MKMKLIMCAVIMTAFVTLGMSQEVPVDPRIATLNIETKAVSDSLIAKMLKAASDEMFSHNSMKAEIWIKLVTSAYEDSRFNPYKVQEMLDVTSLSVEGNEAYKDIATRVAEIKIEYAVMRKRYDEGLKRAYAKKSKK